jgi:hypothetical protein
MNSSRPLIREVIRPCRPSDDAVVNEFAGMDRAEFEKQATEPDQAKVRWRCSALIYRNDAPDSARML